MGLQDISRPGCLHLFGTIVNVFVLALLNIVNIQCLFCQFIIILLLLLIIILIRIIRLAICGVQCNARGSIPNLTQIPLSIFNVYVTHLNYNKDKMICTFKIFCQVPLGDFNKKSLILMNYVDKNPNGKRQCL